MTPTLGTLITPHDVHDLLRPVKRPIHTVFLHCSASDRAEHDSVHVMDRWHRARQWSGVGYHLFLRKDGLGEYGRPWHKTPAAQAGHNSGTLAVCLHGLAEERFTGEQRTRLRLFAEHLDASLTQRNRQATRFRGHREVAAKLCPVIDYRAWLDLSLDGYRQHRAPHLKLTATPDATASAQQWEPDSLRLLDRGPAVLALQHSLTRWGATLTLDGIFGRQTQAAVKAYQRAHWRLTVDGIAGPKTQMHLKQHGYTTHAGL
jgi:hypothetical protein